MIIPNGINKQLLGHYIELKQYHRTTIERDIYYTHMLAVETNPAGLITLENLQKAEISLSRELVLNLVRNSRNSRLTG